MSTSAAANELFEKYKKELDEFQNWIHSQPRLPQNIDKMLLLRFLKVNDFDVHKSQKLLVLYLEIRHSNPEIFNNRDVLSEELQRAAKTIQLVPISKCTSKNQNITIFRLADTDPNNYDPKEVARMSLAELDARFVMCESTELTSGEIAVCDLKGYSFRHMLKAVRWIPSLSGYFKYTQEALPSEIVQNHFINCSSVVHRLLSFMRPFMNKEVFDTIKVHVSIETLYDYIPRDLLPDEYGGTNGSLNDLRVEWEQKLLTKRDYILNDDNWKLND